MPRYYFDVHDSHGFHRDEMGDHFDDFEDARVQAQSLLPDIVRDELPDGELHAVVCEVRDETGTTVYRGELRYQGVRLPAGSDGT